jgi:PAS domain S-box-containing protein
MNKNAPHEEATRLKRGLQDECAEGVLPGGNGRDPEQMGREVMDELKIRNSILSAQQEASLDGILVVNQEGGIVSFNQKFIELWEIPLHVLESKSGEQALESVLNKLKDPQSFINRVNHLYEHQNEKSREEITLIDGRVFDRYSAPIFGEGNEYHGRIWFFRDITSSRQAEEAQLQAYAAVEKLVTERTAKLVQANKKLQQEILERKQAEEAMRESEEKFKILFAEAPDAYYLNDMDGNFIDGNKTAEALLGYTRDELIGKNFIDAGILPEDQMLKAAEILEKGFKGRSAPAEEFKLIRKDSTRVSVEIGSIPIRLEGKKVYLGIARDITARKRLEENLRQAQKMESVGTLAGGIAHDFNNILYPIIGFTEMTMDDVPEKSQAWDNLNEILQATKRAKALVQQILTFSRQKEKDFKPLKIQLILEEAVKLLRATIPASIEIRQSIDTSCRAVMGDSSEIHQVIMNLCTNAYHAMQNEGGVLEIRLTEIDAGSEKGTHQPDIRAGRYARLTVSDTGNGIASDILSRIFEPYFTTKEQGKGTGMGLSVTHGILKSHGGEIRVYSEHLEGTTVCAYLPLIDNKAIDTETASSGETPEGKEHILLVDDEEQIVRMVKQMLDRLGYNVTARLSSTDALEAFSHDPEKFDLVITDMTMPNMMGDTFAKKVMAERPDIPVILCTGFSERMSEQTAESMGISAIISKPIVKNEMAQIIRTVLDA